MALVPLSNRRVWITGGSSGIGRELVRALLARHNRLIVTARQSDRLAEVQALCPERIDLLPCDITQADAAEFLKDGLARLTPALDTVILNAGGCEYVDATAPDIELIERVTQVNYLGFARSLCACMPLLLASDARPHLVGISSAATLCGLPRAEAYGASKAALSYFLESLRADLFSHGVTVSIVNPGFVDTPLTRRNDFPMPWLMTEQQAVARIIRGLERRKHLIEFPAPLTWGLRLLRLLPDTLVLRLAQGMARGKQKNA